MFKNVIVRKPARSMVDGITSAPELGKPDYELAVKQHDAYIEALKQCGVEVMELEALEEYPDACFVEDAAVLTRNCAIITNPGAASRNGEKEHIVAAVKKYSDFDTSAIEQAILDKVDYYVEKFPDEHESKNAEEIKTWIKKKFEIE